MKDLLQVSKRILTNCLGVKPGEVFLVVTDDYEEELASYLYLAGRELGLVSILLKMAPLPRSGKEPPLAVSEAMKSVDVAVCITEKSLTHTKAREEATRRGTRIATMPGITEDMFLEGAITADYLEVEKLTKKVTEKLTNGKYVVIEKDGYKLQMSIEGITGVESIGRYLTKGQSGNLPSGEAYIAPVEGSAYGSILVDGSIVGLGRLLSPIVLRIEKGLLVGATGEQAENWLKILGDSDASRNVAEFGIGTNPNARLTGNILEDEKILGTIHIAFGTNVTFGGKIDAGIHLDAVLMNPTIYIDDKIIMDKGRLII